MAWRLRLIWRFVHTIPVFPLHTLYPFLYLCVKLRMPFFFSISNNFWTVILVDTFEIKCQLLYTSVWSLLLPVCVSVVVFGLGLNSVLLKDHQLLWHLSSIAMVHSPQTCIKYKFWHLIFRYIYILLFFLTSIYMYKCIC